MKQLVKNFEQFVNEAFDPSDNYEPGVYSNCCGAEVIHGDICSECGEHCDVESEEDDYYPPTEHELEDEDDIPHPFGYEEESDDDSVYEKKSRKEVLKDAKDKYPNLKPGSMKKGLEKMKGKDFAAKAKKNFGWADNPEAAAAAYIRKATGKEPKDV